MKFQFNDGGRSIAGFKGTIGDCVTRSIAIATGIPYSEVYEKMHQLNKEYADNHRDRLAKRIIEGKGKRGTTPRNGVSKLIYMSFLKEQGWKWQPTMFIGKGCKVHLKEKELPKGQLIVQVSKHLTTVIDGVINDTHDCSRDETRCVYG